MKRFFSFCLCALLLVGPVPPARALEANPILRVGLFYGGSALPAANLQNETGSGYRFGYYDDSKSFVYLAQTAETKITMLKGENLYLSGTTYSETPGGTPIGMYFVDTGQVFSDYAQAAALAGQYREQGLMGYVHYTDGMYGVRIDSNTTEQNALDLITKHSIAGASVKKAGSTCVTVVITGTDNILFQFDSSPHYLAVLPSLGEVARPLTWFKGWYYAGGFEYRRFNGNLTVVNVVTMQEYAKGVIPYEMSASWPLEALKAQTLCAKTYAIAHLNKHQAQGFDICNSTECQVYHGPKSASANSDRAVDETLGMYITYQGVPAETFYHSSDGGSTEDSGNVWSTDYPYLKAVSDPYEETEKAGSEAIWSYTVTNAALTKLLTDNGYANSGVVNFYVDQLTPAGNVYRVCMIDAAGKKFSFEKEKARTFLNNPSRGMTHNSIRFTINGAGAAAQTTPVSTAADITVRGADGTKALSGGLYIIGAGNIVQQLLSDVKILTANGLQNPAAVSDGSAAPAPQPSTPPAAGDGTYLVQGRGWGHNVGMSQWGARAMAEKGFTYDQIIKFYFTGVDVSY